MNIGARIKHFRELKHFTTNKLANECGLSQSFLRDVELSNKSITIENLALVCDALGITLADFVNIPVEPDEVRTALKAKIDDLSDEQTFHLLKLLNYM